MKTKYPNEVPILTAKDIHTGGLRDWAYWTCQSGPTCLLGHAAMTFGGVSYDDLTGTSFARSLTPPTVSRAIMSACRAVFGRTQSDICGFNDADETLAHKRKVAKAWNLAMAKLGYTEGNPEAKKRT